MDRKTQIPADQLLEEAITALVTVDAAALSRLADSVSNAAMPISQNGYRQNRDVFVALLDATGRNLRLLRRATEQQLGGAYTPNLC
ncbi:MAG: hypothetical protein ACRD3F_04965 [Acidobacteriaceae bacterium]